MHRLIDTCPLCQRFTVTGRNAPQGHGYCDGYETFRRHDDTNEACPLWNRAKADDRGTTTKVTRQAWKSRSTT